MFTYRDMMRLAMTIPDEQAFADWERRTRGKGDSATFLFGACGHLWMQSGFPMLQVSHKLAASFASSRYGSQNIDPPFETTGILIPGGVLCSSEVFVVVNRADTVKGDVLLSMLLVDGKVTPFPVMFSAATLDEDVFPVTDEIGRLQLLVNRIMLGAFIEAQTHGIGRHQSSSQSPVKLKRGLPRSDSYVLGRPVRIDLRSEVLSYAKHGQLKSRGAPTVQTLVAGHYKMQPYGEGGDQRRMIHVEPYWRGPEDAPIVVRPHVLKDGDK